MSTAYATHQPERAEIDSAPGILVLDFGTDWCGYCRAAAPAIAQAVAGQAAARHVKVEDGPGRPLGRSFRVKLWPTLVVLHDGQEVARAVRPTDVSEVSEILSTIAAG